MRENLVKKIKMIMRKKKITGYRIAKETSLSKGYVYSILNSGANFAPKMSTLNELAKGLHMSKEDMYKLANLQYQDVSDDALTNNKIPIMFYDRNTQEYIMNDKVLDKDSFDLVKSMVDKLAK